VVRKPNGELKLSVRAIDTLQALQETSDNIGAEQVRSFEAAQTVYREKNEAWISDDMSGKPPEWPQDLVRTFMACLYAGLTRVNGFLEAGTTHTRSLAAPAVSNAIATTG
jgi:hypothetical protein